MISQAQGPFGRLSTGGRAIFDGVSNGIRAVKVSMWRRVFGSSDRLVTRFKAQYASNGQMFEGNQHGGTPFGHLRLLQVDRNKQILLL